jgi:transcriptional regulator with XRE-family HTH domain
MPEPAGREPLPGSRFLSDVVAEKVRAYRTGVRHMTQDDLADGMRQHRHRTWVRATVSEVERGRRNVTIDEMASLAIVLEVPLVTLLDPVPLGGGPAEPLDVGLPTPIPARMAHQWASGKASLYVTTEKGASGEPETRVALAGWLAPEEVLES